MARKIRIGAVSYLNTRPLVFGIEQGLGRGRIELSYAVPSALADRMRDELLDVALLPVIELGSMPWLEVVPGLGIVTRGDSRSVLMFARRPPAELRSLALDPESRSSNALARVLLREAWNHEPRWVVGSGDLQRDLREHDAVVRIGDKALFDPPPADCRVWDLGRVWTEHTGMPFVFAAWIARHGVVDRQLYGILHESRRQGCAAIDRIADDYTWNGTQYPEISRDYLRHAILYRLGSTEIAAMQLFFELAARAGLLSRAPRIHLAFPHRTGCHEAAGIEYAWLEGTGEVSHG